VCVIITSRKIQQCLKVISEAVVCENKDFLGQNNGSQTPFIAIYVLGLAALWLPNAVGNVCRNFS
jgi:hypothetical protein